MSMIKVISRLFILLSWSLFVFILLLTPLPTSHTPGPPGSDKVVHIVLFGVLSFLIIYCFAIKKTFKYFPVFLFVFLASSLYAAVVEFLQVFIPGRSNSPLDLLAGMIGIIIGESIAYVQFIKFKKT